MVEQAIVVAAVVVGLAAISQHHLGGTAAKDFLLFLVRAAAAASVAWLTLALALSLGAGPN